MRILIAASSAQKGDSLRRMLREHGVIGEIADRADQPGEVALRSGPYDAILIEAHSPSAMVLEMVRGIRRRRLSLPVLVMFAAATPEAEAEALDLGADDVMVFPIVGSSLVVRLRALQRRMLGHVSSTISCGNVVLDQMRRSVAVDGRAVRVTRREYDVLEILMLRRGTLLTKEDFIQRLYGADEGPDSRTLDVFICKLRRKLAAVGAADVIRTAWGRGYAAEEPSPAEIAAARARAAAGPRRRAGNDAAAEPDMADAA